MCESTFYMKLIGVYPYPRPAPLVLAHTTRGRVFLPSSRGPSHRHPVPPCSRRVVEHRYPKRVPAPRHAPPGGISGNSAVRCPVGQRQLHTG